MSNCKFYSISEITHTFSEDSSHVGLMECSQQMPQKKKQSDIFLSQNIWPSYLVRFKFDQKKTLNYRRKYLKMFLEEGEQNSVIYEFTSHTVTVL